MHAAEKIEFDAHGRMKFNPEFHFSHGVVMSESDLEYLCKFYECDHSRSLSFALGKLNTHYEQR